MLEEIYLLYVHVSNTYHICILSAFGYICICWKRPCCIDVYNSYKIDHFDYSCDKVMKFEFFYEK